ncbi:High-affinity nickel-transport protein [Halorientalis persicus]|uniref:High-affinity nickel-transport protein n=1 Tax=Halorientalis persicus TaxID=1367881 RepID=A0A1H8JL37_9EURY|nr:hypothetical protein [Halorientalis persicus]SEN81473.1 High-affinity nickel-transport protein [Halorientalis persicus]
MIPPDTLGLFVGAVALGAIHGIEPGHGWPVAASYALDQTNKWLYGFAASFILGVGHLISSIAMVAVFFYAKSYFSLTEVNEPIELVAGVLLGGPVSVVAGVLLILLGIREYRHGSSHEGHNHAEDHTHSHEGGHRHGDTALHGSVLTDAGHHSQESGQDHPNENYSHDHDAADSFWARLKALVPFVGGHSHSDGRLDETPDRGLLGIAWFAFLLGFAHEEEFEIIALCAGSNYCLELMSAYALTVIIGIVGLTLLLIAGYEHYEATVEQYTLYLPAFSATVLITMGVGFILGVF